MTEVLAPRARARLRDRWLNDRLDRVVPEVMDREGIDAWVLVAREYNEDPVLRTMLPATWLSARRITMLLFVDGGRRRVAVTRYPVGDAFPAAWDPAVQPDQWRALAAALDEADPRTIAVGVSPGFAFGDGLSKSHHDALIDALPERLRDRIVGGERLAIGWLETRTGAEMQCYPGVCAIAHGILREGLSARAIHPSQTSTADLEWWYRQRVDELGLHCWFHPTVSIQRHGNSAPSSFGLPRREDVIGPGDLVHVDFGIEYVGLHTDMQEMLYVGLPGESAPPPGLQTGLVTANRLQDIVMGEFAAGKTGNEILASARARAIAEGITPAIYSHPIGLHGHGAGPTIGLWDQQDGVPGAGDYPVHPNTAYSIELNVRVPVPEWGDQEVAFMLEDNAFFGGDGIEFMDGRQTELWFLGS